MFKPKIIKKVINITEIFTAFETYYSTDFSFAGESHDFWEMVYVIDGQISVSADSAVYLLSKNEIIFHKPMEFHMLKSEKNTNPKLLIMSFNASGQMLEKLSSGVFRLNVEQNAYLFQLLGFLRQSSPSYNKNKTINDFMGTSSPFFTLTEETWQTMASYTEIFLLSMCGENNIKLNVLNNKEAVIYKNAIEIMEDNITENISVTEIANKCLVSESYIKNVFSKYAGIGLHKYFLKMKINYASNLLKDGVSVTEISKIMSFSSQNYFSMVFKRETGVSPLEYRNKYK